MAGWFARLMQQGRASHHRSPGPRDARYDAIVQMLRDREADDRRAREQRQQWYGQRLKTESGAVSSAWSPSAPIRLHKLRTRVPCRVTPEARALLDALGERFPAGTVTLPQEAGARQFVMLSAHADAEPQPIGWVERTVQTDPKLCNVRHNGLLVDTDGGGMLVLRFSHPPTAVRMTSRHDHEREDGVSCVDFTEIRPALDLRSPEKGSSPRLVWTTRPHEAEAMDAVRSRDYEAFYARLKLEVLTGIWSALSDLLASAPTSQWCKGTHYTVVLNPDPTIGRILQRTVDDSGHEVDIGSDRSYDACAATDILLLYLEGDILADFADICFTLQSLDSADAYFLKEEFFTVVRRFWAAAPSLASHYGSDVAAVMRMSQRAEPMPAQAPLLKQDWTNLRQLLVDRYGEGGRNAAELAGDHARRHRTASAGWPFATFPAGEVNIGLRVVYRQEWRCLGAQLGETAILSSDPAATLDSLVDGAVNATVDAMRWTVDFERSVNTGARDLASRTGAGLEAECRESSRDTGMRLSDIMRSMASRIREDAAVAASVNQEADGDPSSAEVDDASDPGAVTSAYSTVPLRYEVLTRVAEIQNVVLIAERLPAPAEVDRSWVMQHRRILAKVLLDEAFRGTLDDIDEERTDAELDATRERLYQHLRGDILHYQRAIWRQEDPQQRNMRYRKSGRKVALEWRFELESGGALTIHELGARLAAPNVDAQFVAYSSGPQIDLDQLIDPAGPIGYYGNYAICHMRPEFGAEELFSMLHFFKSPYLQPNPDTGAPEVEDPVQIQLGDDSAAFHRARARRFTLETAGVVVHVVRRPEATTAESDGMDDDVGLSQPPEGCQLLVEGGRGIELLDARGHRDGDFTWSILRSDRESARALRAGPGGAMKSACETEVERVIIAEPGAGMLALPAGDRAARSGDPMAGGAGIVAHGVGRQGSSLPAGAGVGPPHDAGIDRAIRWRDDGERAHGSFAGMLAVPIHEPVLVARDDASLRPSPVAG